MVEWYKDTFDFYELTTTPDSNIIETQFESGKVRYTLKNSTPKKTHNFNFDLKNKDDELNFWTWYSDTLLSRTQTVKLLNLISGKGFKEYRVTEEPSVSEGSYPKTCSMSVREE